MKLLHEEAQLVSIQVCLVKEGKLHRYQRGKYKQLQGKISFEAKETRGLKSYIIPRHKLG